MNNGTVYGTSYGTLYGTSYGTLNGTLNGTPYGTVQANRKPVEGLFGAGLYKESDRKIKRLSGG